MGTLNPYQTPFRDGNWIIDTANAIGVNHFWLKPISKMFEMFVLLINEINPHSFCFVSSPTQKIAPQDLLYCIFENLPWEFDVAICRRNLPWEFAAGICRGYLPWEFALGFFVYISESFFVYASKSCLYGDKLFLYVCKTCWFVRFSLLTVLLLVIVVAVMGHRTY